MAGGLMQLVAYGAQDVYLTGNPQITFFKVVYRRHTNFSMECVSLPINGAGFGRRNQVLITRNGDLITKMYLMVQLDKLTLTEGSKAAWVRRVGHALLRNVEVNIGGSQIDKHYGTWLDIWYELAREAGDLERGFNHMIGDIPALTSYDETNKEARTLYVPLKFWFNRHVGLALPLISLQYHEVRLNFEFEQASRLVVANKHFLDNDSKTVQMRDASLLVDYIYIDSEERRRFAQVGHEYLIEQLQFTGEVTASQVSGKYELDFNHPTKELIWAMRNGHYSTGKSFLGYTDEDDWCMEGETGILYKTAEQILLDSVVLLAAEVNTTDPSGAPCTVIDSDANPKSGTWEEFCPEMEGTSSNDKITVRNLCPNKTLWLNTDSLKCGTYSLTNKISADILVDETCNIKISNLSTTLSCRDLSIPVECLEDTRYTRDDVYVYMFSNYGVLINGEGNPVKSAIIQLNGLDRFDRREGDYFNYVQPDQHHTNTPKDGINVYSFALNPEQHQPSGTANLSRIDKTLLQIVFEDPTKTVDTPVIKFLNAENQLFIFAFSYNVLRIMSGMGGLAYSS
jgi:hypothetical protein